MNGNIRETQYFLHWKELARSFNRKSNIVGQHCRSEVGAVISRHRTVLNCGGLVLCSHQEMALWSDYNLQIRKRPCLLFVDGRGPR